MSSVSEKVGEFYDKNAQDEWERLDRHRTEFEVTMKALREFLPEAPRRLLDVGGGPGRYSIALARLGYSVTLFDLSQGCLELAQQKSKELGVELSATVGGNALSLRDFAEETFDVVLLMGPLYHLLSENDRRQAVSEARRVLKPNGILFATVISRYAPIRWCAKNEPEWFETFGKEILETGIWAGPETSPSTARVGFTASYFALPSELVPLMESEGFRTLSLIGCEGAVSLIEERINELNRDRFEAWVELNYIIGKDSIFRGAAEHLLYIGRKPSMLTRS